MSRSYKKRPIRSLTSPDSNAFDKMVAHRRFRKKVKMVLKNGRTSCMPYRMRDVFDIKLCGKQWQVDIERVPVGTWLYSFIAGDNMQESIKKAKRK